jgi:hypothetical protein
MQDANLSVSTGRAIDLSNECYNLSETLGFTAAVVECALRHRLVQMLLHE